MGVSGSALRPSVAAVANRVVLAWSDDHESPGHQHIYDVLLDPAGRTLSHPRDITPEGRDVARGQLVTAGDRIALVYGDKSGSEVGVRVRWIDEEGRIAGASLQVGGARPSEYTPDLKRAPDGFFATWGDDRAPEGGADLYLRHLGRELEPIGPEIRATDYRGRAGHRPFIRAPAVAVANNAVYLVYSVQREGKPATIERMRIPFDSKDLNAGLDFGNSKSSKDRALGDVQVVSDDHFPSDSPDIACGTEGCFVAWHGEKGGAFAALIDPVQGRVVWRKRFAERGTSPALGVSDNGTVAVAYYDSGAVRIAQLAREGVSAPSSFARVSGEPPRPSVSPGRTKGEWFVAWHGEKGGAFAARIDPEKGRVMWHKKIAEKGSAPALSDSEDGAVTIAYAEAGTVRFARLTRDGVGAPSVFARVSGDSPRLSVSPGRTKGEWFVAWQESEGAHSEIYAARLTCRL